MPKVILQGSTLLTEEWNSPKGPDLNIDDDDNAYTYGMEPLVY
jgi:hypothetical protein